MTPCRSISLSVALLTRNRPGSLERAIASLRAQDEQPFEVVISDDSDDEFVSEIKTIAQKFGNAPELIAFAILAPHPRMNVALSRREAQDIAAYIATLAK